MGFVNGDKKTCFCVGEGMPPSAYHQGACNGDGLPFAEGAVHGRKITPTHSTYGTLLFFFIYVFELVVEVMDKNTQA